MTKLTSPRGIRNNNPFNIRKGIQWQGLRPEQTDSVFCQFKSMLYGVRAGMKLLKNYVQGSNGSGRPVDTPEAIISRWAPSNENDTEAYISFVCGVCGFYRQQRISWYERRNMIALGHAITRYECGVDLGEELFAAAYDLLS